MRLNMDCVRDILISSADNLVPDRYGYVSPLDPIQLYQSELSQYSQNEVLYWIRQLMESGIIVPGRKYVDDPFPQIKDLSMTGYQFIDSVKSESVWGKIKPKLIECSVSTISSLIMKSIEIAIGVL